MEKKVAGFVKKTYEMVSDPSSDDIVGWGMANNSFQVLDIMQFSERILPSYFNHNNFSTFVRQLNTYGFRKVDPDKWEFANEHFLRAQNHLLLSIVRQKNRTRSHGYYFQDLVIEMRGLTDEQRALDKELKEMKQRLEVTQRRPRQIMAFLNELARDPDILTRVITQRDRSVCSDDNGEKRRRLLTVPSPPSESWGTPGAISSISASFDVDQSTPPDQNGFGSLNNSEFGFLSTAENYDWSGRLITGCDQTDTCVDVVDHVPEYLSNMVSSLPYPFSLLEFYGRNLA